ncbi:MAG: hypothetical protein ACRDOL_02690 [Streptosporangiaceae bacterium]
MTRTDDQPARARAVDLAARMSPERAWPSKSSTREARPQTSPSIALEERSRTSW